MNLYNIICTYLFVYVNGSSLRRVMVALTLLIVYQKGNIVSYSYNSKTLNSNMLIQKETTNQNIIEMLKSQYKFLFNMKRQLTSVCRMEVPINVINRIYFSYRKVYAVSDRHLPTQGILYTQLLMYLEYMALL